MNSEVTKKMNTVAVNLLEIVFTIKPETHPNISKLRNSLVSDK